MDDPHTYEKTGPEDVSGAFVRGEEVGAYLFCVLYKHLTSL